MNNSSNDLSTEVPGILMPNIKGSISHSSSIEDMAKVQNIDPELFSKKVKVFWLHQKPCKWTKREVNIIKTAVKRIYQGMSIYSQVRRLKVNPGVLLYRSWDSIRSKIRRERQKFEDACMGRMFHIKRSKR